MEDAGFEIWDTLLWLHGQGFPKGGDISKLIDKQNENERPVVGKGKRGSNNTHSLGINLCKYLATLILPPSSVEPRRLLVPFSGSGSEMIGALQAGWDDVTGVEMDADYYEIARKRIAHNVWHQTVR